MLKESWVKQIFNECHPQMCVLEKICFALCPYACVCIYAHVCSLLSLFVKIPNYPSLKKQDELEKLRLPSLPKPRVISPPLLPLFFSAFHGFICAVYILYYPILLSSMYLLCFFLSFSVVVLEFAIHIYNKVKFTFK